MSFQETQVLLFVAVIVSMLCRRLKIPYTVGLTLAGAALAFIPSTAEIKLTKELIFSAFLPPLIFEAAFQIPLRELKKNWPVVASLAVVGVLLSVFVVVGGLAKLMGWPLPSAFALAILISATDPVSVIATFKDAKVIGRLKLLVESESLFNDGTAAVLFAIALVALGGGALGPVSIGTDFLYTLSGGVVCGAVVAGGALVLSGRTHDHLVEATVTSLAAYASFFIAEEFHFSGVLATLTAGIVLGNFGSLASFSEKGREVVESFWEYVAFVANSLVFLLIGLRVAHHSFDRIWLTTLEVIGLSLVGRAVAVYATCGVFFRSKHKVEVRHQHVLVWGGLRGALALALALGLPDQTPYREEILGVTFGVVAFSVIVQGLTVTPLLRWLKLVGSSGPSVSG